MPLKEKKKAFTIIEMVMVTFLIGILSFLVATMLTRSTKSYKFGVERLSLNEAAAKSVRDFEKITRGATSVVSANTNTITFFAYLLGDNHPAPSKISYYLESSTLYRSVISPVEVGDQFTYPETNIEIIKISENVLDDNFFNYYNALNQELALPVQLDNIRAVRFTVSIDNDINLPPSNVAETTVVQLRNLKTNL